MGQLFGLFDHEHFDQLVSWHKFKARADSYVHKESSMANALPRLLNT